jgi:ATP-dependent DNA helicase RecG
MSSSASKLLGSSLANLPGIELQLVPYLTKLGIRRGVDLVFFFPRTYEQPAPLLGVEQFVENLRVSFVGTIVDISERVSQSGKHMFGLQVAPDGGGSVRLLWFNQMFRRSMYRRRDRLLVTGVLRSTGLNWEMVQPQTAAAEAEVIDTDRPLPIYPLTEGLKQSAVRSVIRQFVPRLIDEVEEVMPTPIRERLNVPGIHQALNELHFPPTIEQAEAAMRRFKLQELLVLQLALAMQRRQREQAAQAPTCELSGKVHARILNRLRYALTPDQAKAIEEIRHDMARSIPMNRLLQGDVGSGKTLVAQYAMLLCVANEHQAALMAPTEVLARQHFQSLQQSLGQSRVRVGLLIGSMSRRDRAQLLEQVSLGEVDLVVGTQALLSNDVQFKRLGLVIVDEQHKFGVLQRARLRQDTTQPHGLILSATPIPRTIAMSAFGDLDVSTIHTKPPGRATVHTYLATRNQLDSWWNFVVKQIQQGRQGYVIAPRVAEVVDTTITSQTDNQPDEPSDNDSAATWDNQNHETVDKSDESSTNSIATAEGTFRMLKQGPLGQLRIGLLHGRMDSEAKELVLQSFNNGELDLLVSTTVVEVGIDVPNATVITILDANRLGLSQLHQLRGRISRGTFPGYACAVASEGCDASDNQRLVAFRDCNDGFELAEKDLQLRGPGDLLGTSQTGLPTMRIANLITDGELLVLARSIALEVLEQDPLLNNPQLALLIQQTLRRYGKSLQLGDVG